MATTKLIDKSLKQRQYRIFYTINMIFTRRNIIRIYSDRASSSRIISRSQQTLVKELVFY